MTLYQSIPTFSPLIHFPPSEMGPSSTWQRVLYDFLPLAAPTGWAVITVGVKRTRIAGIKTRCFTRSLRVGASTLGESIGGVLQSGSLSLANFVWQKNPLTPLLRSGTQSATRSTAR